LVNEGRLSQSFHYNASSDLLEIGSNMEYAAMQQFGGTKEEFPHLWGAFPHVHSWDYLTMIKPIF